MLQSTELTPVPWDDPKTQLPSTESTTVAQAHTLAQAVLANEVDADPLAIKSRAQATMHLCDERDWQEAKRAFAYLAVCCEFRWVQDNPRQPVGVHNDFQGGNQVPGSTASRLHDAYEGATADDVSAAGDAADAQGEPINRGHVRQAVENPADGVRRRATGAAQRAKAKREEKMADHLGDLKGVLEDYVARTHAAESELLALYGETVDLRSEGEIEMSRARINLVQRNEALAAEIVQLREKLTTAEGQVAYWKASSNSMETALQRGDDGG